MFRTEIILTHIFAKCYGFPGARYFTWVEMIYSGIKQSDLILHFYVKHIIIVRVLFNIQSQDMVDEAKRWWIKIPAKGMKDGSVVRNTGCSCRGAGFDSQLPIICNLGCWDLTPFLASVNTACTWYRMLMQSREIIHIKQNLHIVLN